jgi:hypothetical protein
MSSVNLNPSVPTPEILLQKQLPFSQKELSTKNLPSNKSKYQEITKWGTLTALAASTLGAGYIAYQQLGIKNVSPEMPLTFPSRITSIKDVLLVTLGISLVTAGALLLRRSNQNKALLPEKHPAQANQCLPFSTKEKSFESNLKHENEDSKREVETWVQEKENFLPNGKILEEETYNENISSVPFLEEEEVAFNALSQMAQDQRLPSEEHVFSEREKSSEFENEDTKQEDLFQENEGVFSYEETCDEEITSVPIPEEEVAFDALSQVQNHLLKQENLSRDEEAQKILQSFAEARSQIEKNDVRELIEKNKAYLKHLNLEFFDEYSVIDVNQIKIDSLDKKIKILKLLPDNLDKYEKNLAMIAKLIQECKDIISYLGHLKSPLNQVQYTLVKSFTSFLQEIIKQSKIEYAPFIKALPKDLISNIYQIDKNCALDLLKTCVTSHPGMPRWCFPHHILSDRALINADIKQAYDLRKNFAANVLEEEGSLEDNEAQKILEKCRVIRFGIEKNNIGEVIKKNKDYLQRLNLNIIDLYYQTIDKQLKKVSEYNAILSIISGFTTKLKKQTSLVLDGTNKILEECLTIIDYLDRLQPPLNNDQQVLVRHFTTFLQDTIKNAYVERIKILKILPYNLISKIFQIDKNCALDLLKTCINRPNPYPWNASWCWHCDTLSSQALKNNEIKEAYFTDLNEKFIKDILTVEECESIINYIMNKVYPQALSVEEIFLVQFLVYFVIEKIDHPENIASEEDFSKLLDKTYELLINLESSGWRHNFTGNLSRIAQACITAPGPVSENLKKRFELMVKHISQHNEPIVLEALLESCNNLADEFHQDKITRLMTYFLAAEGRRIQYSFENHIRELVDDIFERFTRDPIFKINSALYLCRFLRESTKNQNEIFKKCLLDGFKDAIEIELNRNRRWDSPLLICSVDYLIKKENYRLALSLLQIYAVSKARDRIRFIKQSYEALLKVSLETANELADYCRQSDNEELKELFKNTPEQVLENNPLQIEPPDNFFQNETQQKSILVS